MISSRALPISRQPPQQRLVAVLQNAHALRTGRLRRRFLLIGRPRRPLRRRMVQRRQNRRRQRVGHIYQHRRQQQRANPFFHA